MLSLFLEMAYLLTNPKHTEMKNKKCQTIKGLSPYYISSPTLRNNDFSRNFFLLSSFQIGDYREKQEVDLIRP